MNNKRACNWIPLIFFLFLIYTSAFAQIPSGYYNAAVGKSGDSLRKALSVIINTGHNKLSYSNIWNFFDSTDIRPGTANKIWDMYSDIPGGTPAYIYTFSADQCTGGVGAEGVCYSREHCFPNSWFGALDDLTHPYSDLHHLYPADQYVNQYKSNNPIGKVGTATKTFTNLSKVGPCITPGYTGTVYEPIDAYKGDFARAFLYIATCYADSMGAWVKRFKVPESVACIDTVTNNFKPWFRDLLLSWHNNDPVSTKEINRNNVVYRTYQANRNPFVDHPEYANYIWSPQVPITKLEPSNHVSSFQSVTVYPHSSSIKLTWTDAGGTITPDGYIIKAQTDSNNFIIPTDGIPEVNNQNTKVIFQGNQTATFTGLIPDTVYYFKIFPFTNSDTSINYKIDGNVPITYDTTAIFKEDFEYGTKTAYEISTVNNSTGSWTLNDALLGNLATDRKNGTKSARVRVGTMYMNFDKEGGAAKITLYHAKYGTDANKMWKISISTNSGVSWTLLKDSIITNTTTLTPLIIDVNQSGKIRIKIESSSNLRNNIDDIIITNYAPTITYKTIKIKAFLEGLFNGTNMNMVQNETGNQFSANIADKITVELRDSISPFTKVFTDTNAFLDINGNILIDSVPSSLTANYYLVLRHRNHIETWSSLPVSLINDTTVYDFSTSDTKAYGNNMKFIETTANNKSQSINDISELKSFNYNPDRFSILIKQSKDLNYWDITVTDKLSKKKYIKKVHKNVLFYKSDKR